MKRRTKAYKIFSDRFAFLTELKSMSDWKYIREKTNYFVHQYYCDSEADFTNEIIVFFEILKMERNQVNTVRQMLKNIIGQILTFAFPNVRIVFQICFSTLATSCEREQSFSKMKRVKNYPRSTTGQEKLTNSLLSVFSSTHRKTK